MSIEWNFMLPIQRLQLKMKPLKRKYEWSLSMDSRNCNAETGNWKMILIWAQKQNGFAHFCLFALFFIFHHFIFLFSSLFNCCCCSKIRIGKQKLQFFSNNFYNSSNTSTNKPAANLKDIKICMCDILSLQYIFFLLCLVSMFLHDLPLLLSNIQMPDARWKNKSRRTWNGYKQCCTDWKTVDSNGIAMSRFTLFGCSFFLLEISDNCSFDFPLILR